MHRFALAFAAFVSLASATPAVAGEVEKVAVPNVGTITYEHLFEAVSEANEGLDDFMARISPRLRGFSDETGFEACGVVARNDEGRFAVNVGTNHSHVACVNFASKVPKGFHPTMETIHSHGGEKTFAASTTDVALLGKDAFGSRSRTSLRVTGQNLHMFSKTDYHGGAGYLATPNGAIYQNGPKKVREVAAR